MGEGGGWHFSLLQGLRLENYLNNTLPWFPTSQKTFLFHYEDQTVTVISRERKPYLLRKLYNIYEYV